MAPEQQILRLVAVANTAMSTWQCQHHLRAGKVNLFRRTLSADCDTPVSVFARLRGDGECFLFESAEGGEHFGRYSIIGFEPSKVAVEQQERLKIHQRDGKKLIHDGENILSWIRSEVIEHNSIENIDALPFSGGAVGYFSYDIVHQFEPGVHATATESPLAAFMLIDRFVIMDSLKGVMHLCVLEKNRSAAKALLDSMEQRLAENSVPEPMHLEASPTSSAIPQSHMGQAEYESMVEQAKEYILAGDIFQVVLSQRFSAPLTCDPLSIYRAVRHINPSPYLFYLHVDDTVLIGSSPEILVRKEGDRAIVRPIAGTRPRGATIEEDLALEQDLLQDKKELAEHVMLVDLGRNDLGRVCEYGSVVVSESMCVERYSHVMHIVSEVVGRLRSDVDALDLLAATFPAGTLSGAPKIRAMQIIDELEDEVRGPYGGCIGHISFGGEQMDTAIIIRTAVIQNGQIYVQAGAGIVADSDPASEHQECVNKATAMFRSVALAQEQSK
jgi:anthranilate synthase component 1